MVKITLANEALSPKTVKYPLCLFLALSKILESIHVPVSQIISQKPQGKR